MLSLTIGDVALDEQDGGIIKLAHTKSGQRHAAFEVATIHDHVVAKLCRFFQRSLPAGTNTEHYIFAGSAMSFYQLLDDGLKWLGVSELGFNPAPSGVAVPRLITDARSGWASYRVARIYINDGLAKEVEMQFSTLVRMHLGTKASALALWLASQ